MAFPGTYNISYYLGDTLEFTITPKNSDGSRFDVSTFDVVKFIIAPTRGAAVADQIAAYALIDTDNKIVRCAIRPEDAANMDPTIQYLYDIEISRSLSSPNRNAEYPIVHTLLTGTLTITQDITTEESGQPEPVPNNPTTLTTGTITDTTIQVSWVAATTGGAAENYRIAIIPFTEDSATKVTAITESTVSVDADTTSYTFGGLTENTDYTVLILATNSTGNADLNNALTNGSPITTTDNPGTVEPDFFVTNDGSSAYLIDGVSNDTITVERGQTYAININATGHPFWIQSVPAPYDEINVYNIGVANNGAEIGNILWTVAQDAPDTLFYACQIHSSMGGTIIVVDGVS